jgi:hypothetical protein
VLEKIDISDTHWSALGSFQTTGEVLHHLEYFAAVDIGDGVFPSGEAANIPQDVWGHWIIGC